MRHALRNFFFPPAGSPWWVRLLPYAFLGVLTFFVLVGSVYAWDYTNSPQFCGESCHTMPPEYTAYLLSPHAEVDCVECHIGRGFFATRVSRKAGDLEHVFDTTFHNYEFPIRAKKMRPASETCEKCHSPAKFSDDSLREIRRYDINAANTPTSTYLVLKTGGGTARQGLGRGIHWHIENPVYYLPTDELDQEIPYIRVVNDDGTTTDYLDINSDLDTSAINPDDLKQMDCITCHNRITHLVLTPEDTVDQLMSRGLISPSIPSIRALAVEVYGAEYPTVEAGQAAIGGLMDWYKQNHAEFVAQNPGLVDAAIVALQDAYAKSNFPEQQVNYATHPNNIGHKDSPGCFRCHDGKHLNAEQEPIRLECNLCHSIPVVAGPPDFLADIEVSRGLEPSSHLDPSWIHMHREVFDTSCVNCHTTDDPGGTSNTSFCSNSACHGNVWEYAGFDAPGLREIVLAQLPAQPTPTPLPAAVDVTYEAVIGPVFAQRCTACHGGSSPVQELDLTTYQGALRGGAGGPAIVAGDSTGSLLVQVQSGPQNHFGQLSPEELDLVAGWIDAGAPAK
jgi:hypothetical protein